jgi:hypothetical protein
MNHQVQQYKAAHLAHTLYLQVCVQYVSRNERLSLSHINRLAFVTHYVLCEIRTECLCIILINFSI